MSQTLLQAHDHQPPVRRSQVLLLVAVATAASLLTAAVMGSGQADMDPLQRAVAHTAPPTSGPGTPMPLDSTMPDAGSPSPAADLPVQEPAPTF